MNNKIQFLQTFTITCPTCQSTELLQIPVFLPIIVKPGIADALQNEAKLSAKASGWTELDDHDLQCSYCSRGVLRQNWFFAKPATQTTPTTTVKQSSKVVEVKPEVQEERASPKQLLLDPEEPKEDTTMPELDRALSILNSFPEHWAYVEEAEQYPELHGFSTTKAPVLLLRKAVLETLVLEDYVVYDENKPIYKKADGVFAYKLLKKGIAKPKAIKRKQ